MERQLNHHGMDDSDYIQPSELYKWTITNLPSYSLDVQKRLLEILQKLTWIPEFLDSLPQSGLEIAKMPILLGLDDESSPICLMSMTCFLYNLEQRGVDVTDLRHAINSSKRVKNEILRMIHNNF